MAYQVSLPDLSPRVRTGRFLIEHPPVMRQPWLLSLENESCLLSSRSAVLAKAGCRVRSCTSFEASKLIGSVPYHVIVFGHSLSNAECGELAVSARTAVPGAKLLLLQAFELRWLQIEQLFDAILPAYDGPAALIKEVRDLLPQAKTMMASPRTTPTT